MLSNYPFIPDGSFFQNGDMSVDVEKESLVTYDVNGLPVDVNGNPIGYRKRPVVVDRPDAHIEDIPLPIDFNNISIENPLTFEGERVSPKMGSNGDSQFDNNSISQNPLIQLLNKKKKTPVEVGINFNLNLINKEFFNLLDEEYENVVDDLVEFIMQDLSRDVVKNSIKTFIYKYYGKEIPKPEIIVIDDDEVRIDVRNNDRVNDIYDNENRNIILEKS